MKKSDLKEKIKRNLGYPVVKVELDEAQIDDAIDFTRNLYIKWAVGNATQEYFFTLMLSGGVTVYDLPGNVVEVLGYDMRTTGSVHTLFTVENYLYNQGYYDMLYMGNAAGGSQYNLVSYHIARDFLDTVKRYVVDAYNFKYHRYTNQLEVAPAPPTNSSVVFNNVTYNSPGWILIRSYMIEGLDEDLYGLPWIQEYATAYCKKTLGRIRSKFANFSSIGQTGLSMDGDALLSEAQAEIEKLEERLRLEEPYEGYDISIG